MSWYDAFFHDPNSIVNSLTSFDAGVPLFGGSLLSTDTSPFELVGDTVSVSATPTASVETDDDGMVQFVPSSASTHVSKTWPCQADLFSAHLWGRDTVTEEASLPLPCPTGLEDTHPCVGNAMQERPTEVAPALATTTLRRKRTWQAPDTGAPPEKHAKKSPDVDDEDPPKKRAKSPDTDDAPTKKRAKKSLPANVGARMCLDTVRHELCLPIRARRGAATYTIGSFGVLRSASEIAEANAPPPSADNCDNGTVDDGDDDDDDADVGDDDGIEVTRHNRPANGKDCLYTPHLPRPIHRKLARWERAAWLPKVEPPKPCPTAPEEGPVWTLEFEDYVKDPLTCFDKYHPPRERNGRLQTDITPEHRQYLLHQQVLHQRLRQYLLDQAARAPKTPTVFAPRSNAYTTTRKRTEQVAPKHKTSNDGAALASLQEMLSHMQDATPQQAELLRQLMATMTPSQRKAVATPTVATAAEADYTPQTEEQLQEYFQHVAERVFPGSQLSLEVVD